MENGPGLKMYFLLKKGHFPASYVSLLEGTTLNLFQAEWLHPSHPIRIHPNSQAKGRPDAVVLGVKPGECGR